MSKKQKAKVASELKAKNIENNCDYNSNSCSAPTSETNATPLASNFIANVSTTPATTTAISLASSNGIYDSGSSTNQQQMNSMSQKLNALNAQPNAQPNGGIQHHRQQHFQPTQANININMSSSSNTSYISHVSTNNNNNCNQSSTSFQPVSYIIDYNGSGNSTASTAQTTFENFQPQLLQNSCSQAYPVVTNINNYFVYNNQKPHTGNKTALTNSFNGYEEACEQIDSSPHSKKHKPAQVQSAFNHHSIPQDLGSCTLNIYEYKTDIANMAKSIIDAHAQTFMAYYDKVDLNKTLEHIDKTNPTSSCVSSSSNGSSSSSNSSSSSSGGSITSNISINESINEREIQRLLSTVKKITISILFSS